MQKIYLEDIPLDDAKAVFTAALEEAGLWDPLPAETISVEKASGRITAEPIWAAISAPHYNASAMDGFAVRSGDSDGATETNPVRFRLIKSDEPAMENELCAQGVDTGQPLPDWADTVVMIEHTQPIVDATGQRGIEIRASLPPWHNVRQMGEDMVATELVLPASHRLRPVDLGALAGSGHSTVSVYRKPRVAIIPTGSELVPVDTAAVTGISPGQIIEYNSIVIAAQVSQWGGLPTRWPIVNDKLEAIQRAVLDAASNHDLILVNAGSSAGSRDFTADVVSNLGRLLVHGVAVRPGHPVILGVVEFTHPRSPIPIIGVPGYPVSAALTGEIFVEPLLSRWQGIPASNKTTLEATISRKVISHTGDDDFVRVAVGKVGERYTATPISRGAGVITSLVRADGIVRIPRFSEGVDAGAKVNVYLYRSPAEIDRTILAIGSHDLTLDLLSQYLSAKRQGLRLSSASVGSLGGLIALRRAEAHLAGSHLLDPHSGQYNLSYVRRYLPGRDVVVVTLVGREQGWIVQAGNPKDIRSWSDVANPDIQIINRQRGAGTRVLLDYQLNQRGIRPEDVEGYDREAYTHLAVAAAVASGIVDTGLGIAAAARALKLDFIPLANERYELIIPREFYESDLLMPLLELLEDAKFRSAVSAMPGYDVGPMGDIQFVGE